MRAAPEPGQTFVDWSRETVAAVIGGHAQPAGDGPTSGHERLRYLPMLTCCYAVVLYDAASAQLVRRIIGRFADPDQADAYARDGGHRLYDVVPATAVTPTPP